MTDRVVESPDPGQARELNGCSSDRDAYNHIRGCIILYIHIYTYIRVCVCVCSDSYIGL